MNSRKVVYLFNTTLLIGTTAGFIIGMILDWQTHMNDLSNLSFGGVAMVIITSAIWTVIAQMGFFAYLTIHRFGLGIFKSVKLWNKVQVVLIVFALFDLMFFRHYFFASEGESLIGYVWMPLLLVVYGLIIASIKSKETDRTAFVPTVFFIVVVTLIEWIPALRENDFTFLITAIVPLLAANTWQILILHRLHRQPNGKQPSMETVIEKEKQDNKSRGKKRKKETQRRK